MISTGRPSTPVTIHLESNRFRFVTGEARLVPLVDGYDHPVGELSDNRITGMSIEAGATLFGFVLTDVTLLAAGRSEPMSAPALLLPTILLTPEKIAGGTYGLKLAARMLVSVQVLGLDMLPDSRGVLAVADSHKTLELPLDADGRATVLLEDGRYVLLSGSGQATVDLVVDETSPAWLDVTLSTGPARF